MQLADTVELQLEPIALWRSIALRQHPPRQRLPLNGPIKTAPKHYGLAPPMASRGSPDRVLSFNRTYSIAPA